MCCLDTDVAHFSGRRCMRLEHWWYDDSHGKSNNSGLLCPLRISHEFARDLIGSPCREDGICSSDHLKSSSVHAMKFQKLFWITYFTFVLKLRLHEASRQTSQVGILPAPSCLPRVNFYMSEIRTWLASSFRLVDIYTWKVTFSRQSAHLTYLSTCLM
jgi:hypothetical protein